MTRTPSVVALLALALAALPAAGQAPYAKPVQETIAEPAAEAAPTQTISPTSRWISTAPALCNTEGQSPPIAAEVYVQSGWSIPVNSWFNRRDALGREMTMGWVIQGGVKTLFFNEPATRAWVVDTSISHHVNGHDPEALYALRVIDFTGNIDPATGQPEVKLIQFGTPTTPAIKIRDTDRTFVNLGLGRNYYWRGSADEPCTNLRHGWDFGARYGCLNQEYDIIRHRTDVIGGVFAGYHAEVEVPSRWGLLQFGSRGEWAYTWSDILQRASDIQEVNVMLTFGLRY